MSTALIPREKTATYRKDVAELDAALQTQLTSISSFTSQLNIPHTKIDAYDYSDAVCIRLHRLLDYAPLDRCVLQQLTPLDRLVHLSLVAVMTTLMPEYGRNSARYFLLANELQEALRTYATVVPRNDAIMLWALFVGHVTILPGSDLVWLLPLATESRARLGAQSWEEMRQTLCRYAWIGVLYDKAGLELWNAMDGGGRGEGQ